MIRLSLENNFLVLSGDTEDIWSDFSLRLFLKKHHKAVQKDSRIEIPVGSDEDVENKLKDLREVCRRAGVDIEFQGKLADKEREFQRQKEEFSAFSEEARSIRNNEFDIAKLEQFQQIIGAEIKRDLYEQQLLSSFHLAFSRNACNFSVPGSGKTSMVMGAYSYLKHHDEVDGILVIGPLSSFGPWEDEYKETFGKPVRSFRLHSGTSKEDRVRYLNRPGCADLTLATYQGVPTLMDDLDYFLQRNKLLVVLDEAHKIKNLDGGIIAESVLQLAPHCTRRIVLTGTPAPNGYGDLYNLFKFIWPNREIIPFRPFQLEEITEEPQESRRKQLIKSIEPFFIRITKADMDLPEPIHHDPIEVEMDAEQEAIYRYIEDSALTPFISNPDPFEQNLIKAKTIRLMQAATHPGALVSSAEDDALADYGESLLEQINSYIESRKVPSKYIRTLELVKQIISEKGKVVIWTTYLFNLHNLTSFLENNGIPVLKVWGDTPASADELIEEELTREKILRTFQDGDKYPVLITNPFSVAESISLHKSCRNAIYLERNFDAGLFMQSKDRIHRYGLPKDAKVNYYYLLSKGTIDSPIHNRLDEKESRMLEAIEANPIPLMSNLEADSELSREDVRAVINDYITRSKQV